MFLLQTRDYNANEPVFFVFSRVLHTFWLKQHVWFNGPRVVFCLSCFGWGFLPCFGDLWKHLLKKKKKRVERRLRSSLFFVARGFLMFSDWFSFVFGVLEFSTVVFFFTVFAGLSLPLQERFFRLL